MRAYYADAWCSIWHGDCLGVLMKLTSDYLDYKLSGVDLVLADPPYCSGGIGEHQRTRAKGQGHRSKNLRRFGWFIGDNMGVSALAWKLRTFALLSRTFVKDSGSLLLFCDRLMIPAIEPAIESAGLRYQNQVIWDKGSFGLGTGFRRQYEAVMHFTYGDPKYYSQSVGDVIEAKRPATEFHHTEKPVELLCKMIEVCTPKNGMVVDPWLGSGSTLVAAKMMGRRALGIDIDEARCETAAKRLQQNYLPLSVEGG